MSNGLLLSSIMLSSLVALPGEVESFSFRGVAWEAACYLYALTKDFSEVEILLREYAQLSLAISNGRDFIAKGDRLAENIFNHHLAISESRLASSDSSRKMIHYGVVVWDNEYAEKLRLSTEKLLEMLESTEAFHASKISSGDIVASFDRQLESAIGAVPMGLDMSLAGSVAAFFDLAVAFRELADTVDPSADFRTAKVVLSQMLRDLEIFERT